jgi:hypothetical protein
LDAPRKRRRISAAAEQRGVDDESHPGRYHEGRTLSSLKEYLDRRSENPSSRKRM